MALPESKTFTIPLSWRHRLRVTFRERESKPETPRPVEEETTFIPLEFTESGLDRITRLAEATGVSAPSVEEGVSEVMDQSIMSHEWIISQQAQGRAVVSVPIESLSVIQAQGLSGEVFHSTIPDNRRAYAAMYYDPSVRAEKV